MTIKINPVKKLKGGNSYCGPAVVSSLTGCNTDEAARVIRSILGRKIVTSSSSTEVSGALEKFGLRCTRVPADGFLINFARKSDVYYVLYSGHWAVVGRGKYLCGIHPKGFDVEVGPEKPSRVYRSNAEVRAAFLVTGEVSGSKPAEATYVAKNPRKTCVPESRG